MSGSARAKTGGCVESVSPPEKQVECNSRLFEFHDRTVSQGGRFLLDLQLVPIVYKQ